MVIKKKGILSRISPFRRKLNLKPLIEEIFWTFYLKDSGMSKECHLRDLVIAFNSKLRADELFTNLYNLNAKNIAYI